MGSQSDRKRAWIGHSQSQVNKSAILIVIVIQNVRSTVHCTFLAQTYAEMDPTTAALEKEHEAVSEAGVLYTGHPPAPRLLHFLCFD